jgi:hemerythrin-like domain-containing protein
MDHQDPAETLHHEHTYILKVVNGLSALADRLRAGGAVEPGTLREAVEFMRSFADRCHHGKEEDLLFPAMEAKGVPESGCPLGALREEHVKGRAAVAALAEATEAYAAEGGHEPVLQAIDRIFALYPNHIWKEDQMVFPMVARLFGAEERARLARRFEDVEEAMPAGLHERAAAFADRLERETG